MKDFGEFFFGCRSNRAEDDLIEHHFYQEQYWYQYPNVF